MFIYLSHKKSLKVGSPRLIEWLYNVTRDPNFFQVAAPLDIEHVASLLTMAAQASAIAKKITASFWGSFPEIQYTSAYISLARS